MGIVLFTNVQGLMQCAIPAFEGLFPTEHNDRIMQLLFTFANWHGFAKLRQHTDHTLVMLDELTTDLGNQLREFEKRTCSEFETRELPREYQARKRREARKKTALSSTKKRKTGLDEMVPSGTSPSEYRSV